MGSHDEPDSDSDDDSIAGRLRHTPEPDYYALLNVSRTATREEVKSSYASLARALHPDKNPQAFDDSNDTSHYNEAFEQVHKAYLVLSSPTYRPIYDEFGLHGVHELQRLTDSEDKVASQPSRKEEEIKRRRMGVVAPLDRWYEMQVSQYDEFGFNLRDRVLDKLRRRRELLDMRNTGLSSTTNAQIDARKCFGSLMTGDVRGMFHNRPSLRLMRLEQWSAMVLSESTQLNASTTVRLDGRGQGVGEITMSGEHTFNDVDTGTVAVGVRTTDPDDDHPHNLDYVMVNARRQLSHDLACTVAVMWREGNVLGLSVNNEIHLDARNKGSFQFGFGCLNFAYLSLNRSSMYRTSRRSHPSRMFLSMWPGSAAAAEKEQTGTEKQQQHVGDVDWEYLTSQHQQDQRWGPSRENGPEEVSSTSTSSRIDSTSDDQVMDDAKNLTLQAGPGSIGSELTWMRSLTKHSGAGLKLVIAASGLRIAVFTKRRWSSARVGEMALSVGTTGLNLDLALGNGLHKLKIPIVLATQVTAPALMVASVIPLLLNYSVLRLLAPMHKRRRQKEILYLKKDLTKERVRARVQLRMMVRAADQRAQQEEERGGLVILLARYGARLGTSCSWDDSKINGSIFRTNKQQNEWSTTPVAVARDGTANAIQHIPLTRSVRRSVLGWVRSAGTWVGSLGGWMTARARVPSDWEEELTPPQHQRGGDSSGAQDGAASATGGNDAWLPPNIDVSSQLQFFVRDGVLKLPASSKSYMLGVYNPCHGLDNVMPELLVRYSFAGQVFEIVAQDVDPLQLPSPRAVHVGAVRGSPVEWRA